MGPQENKRFDPSKSKRVTSILSFSLGRFYKDRPLKVKKNLIFGLGTEIWPLCHLGGS